MKRMLGICLVSSLIACQPPNSAQSLDVTSNADAIVVEARTDEESPRLSVRVEAQDAPAGEYLLFSSESAPTAVPSAMAFDAAACPRPSTRAADAPGCDLPSVGRLREIVQQSASGKLSMFAGDSGFASPRVAYYTLVRRGGSAGVTVAAKLTVEVELAGGCDNPEKPSVRAL